MCKKSNKKHITAKRWVGEENAIVFLNNEFSRTEGVKVHFAMRYSANYAFREVQRSLQNRL